MPPLPAAMVIDRNPDAEANLSLQELDVFILAGFDLAAGPVVG